MRWGDYPDHPGSPHGITRVLNSGEPFPAAKNLRGGSVRKTQPAFAGFED